MPNITLDGFPAVGKVNSTFTQVSVADSAPVLIVPKSEDRRSIVIYNNGDTVYLGGEDVTVDDGFPLLAGSTFQDAGSGNAYYGICGAEATADLRIITVGAL